MQKNFRTVPCILDENDCVLPKFDIGTYIIKLLTHPVLKSTNQTAYQED